MTDTPTTTAPQLTGRQRKHLRGLAHALEPIVHVGGAGVTDGVLESKRLQHCRNCR